jgi:3-oxoacyl-[acyl-carrier protein] reductase
VSTLPLKNRVAFVTGGSKGIGRAICLRLAEAGAAVIVAARGRGESRQVEEEIAAAGGSALALHLDVTNGISVAHGVETVLGRFGRLDILVNNAGGALTYGTFDEIKDDAWLAAFNLNVLGIVHSVRSALPSLKSSPCARIITISSISGTQPGFFNPHYSAMKAATINLSKTLSKIHAADGILVNTICPGPIHSDAWQRNVENLASVQNISVEEAWKLMEKIETAKIPLGRVGEGRDVAGLVAFLASDEAAWITGSCFHVNGGKLSTI